MAGEIPIKPSPEALAFLLREEEKRQGREPQQSGMGGGMGGGMSSSMASPDYATANQTFDTENASIRQQRALAMQMMRQAGDSPGIVTAGRMSAPGANVFSGLAQGLRGYMGGKGIADAREQEAGVLEQQAGRDEALAGLEQYKAQQAVEAEEVRVAEALAEEAVRVDERGEDRRWSVSDDAADRQGRLDVAQLRK
jgi:hypothetical protein